MMFGRVYHSLWIESIALGLEWMNWSLALVTLEGFSFTISNGTYCVKVDGEHDHSPKCDAIYAGIAVAGVELILFTISVGFVMFAVKSDYRTMKDLEENLNTRVNDEDTQAQA
jgi:hypothetical protein